MQSRSIPVDNADYEKLQYYYHSDHLGSASYITNLDGEVVQHIEYVPFGEVFLEERNNTWNTPFLFNGKELDEETGLYYYGARYYNPRISLWYGVDPLNEERYGLSPYQYCQNSPVMLTDPTGMLDDDYFNRKGKYLGSDDAKLDFVRIIDEKDWNTHAEEGKIGQDKGQKLSSSNVETQLSDEAIVNILKHYDDQLTGVQKGRNGETVEIKAGYVKSPNDFKVVMQYSSSSHFELFGFRFFEENAAITTNTEGGFMPKMLNTGSNIKNTLAHEYDHSIAPTMHSTLKEMRAIKAPKAHSTFDKTTPQYQEKINNYEEYYKNKK